MIDREARERRLMSCLGDPSRYQLVTLLLRGERCVSDLAQEVGLSQSCTTRHLQALQREQMVRGERDGKRVMFRLRLDDPEVRSLVAWAISERLSGDRVARSASARSGHGGDLHTEGPPRRARDDRSSRPAPPAPRTRGRRPATGNTGAGVPAPVRAAEAPARAEPTGTPSPIQDHEHATPDPPVLRRSPRNDIEDYLL